jgi:cobalamin biosynthesis protein CobT
LEKTAENAMQVAFNEGVNTRLAVLLRKAVNAASTQDCLNLTNSILKMLEEEEKEESALNSKNDSEENDSSDSEQCSEELHDDDLADSDDSSNDTRDKDGCDTDERVIDTQAAKNIRKALDSSEDDLSQDVFEALKQDLLEVADGASDEDYCTVPVAPATDENLLAGEEMLNAVKSATIRLRAQLMGLVQSSRMHQDRAAYNGRRLYSSYLHRVLSGDARIYRKREHREAPNTSVHILTDFSGSMRGQSCHVASHSSLAIALALETIEGVNPAVTYFGGGPGDSVRAIVKHGQSINKQAKCFPQMVWGTTPMAEAVWYAAFELSKTAEKRKVLLVITDGDPDNEVATHRVLNLCRNAGIETLGIGIAQRGIERFFDRSVVIGSVDELQQTLFRLMQDTLTVQVA